MNYTTDNPKSQPDFSYQENSILGAILYDAVTFDDIRLILPDETAFQDPKHRKIYNLILENHVNGKLTNHVGVKFSINDNALQGYVSQLFTDYQLDETSMIIPYCQKLAEEAEKRALVNRLKDLDTELTPSEIRDRLIEIVEDNRSCERVFSKEITFDIIPEYEPSIIEFDSENILESGNIAGIVAGAGFGKSQICEALIANFVNPACDAFGFKVQIPKGKIILYLDTERSLKHTRAGLGRIAQRIGLECEYSEKIKILTPTATPNEIKFQYPDFPRFKYLSLNEIPSSLKKRQEVFRLIHLHRDRIGLLIIDGYGELVQDANDPVVSDELFTGLKSLANRYQFGVWGTIHSNPNSDKPRGHLGSEAWRIMQSLLLLQKAKSNPDVRLITSQFDFGKNRAGGDNLNSAFQWDKDKRMMVSTVYETTAEDKRQMDFDLMYSRFEQVMQPKETINQSILIDRYVSAKFAKNETTAQRHVKKAVELEVIEELQNNTDLRNKLYRLLMLNDSNLPYN